MRKNIADKLQNCIVGFEKWAPVSETPQTIMKQFIVIALIIFNCAKIVYVRVRIYCALLNRKTLVFQKLKKVQLQSRSNCFFNIAMSQYILPCPVMMSKQQKLGHVQAVLKVWHLIIGGIEKLDYQSDAQLNKVFTDLIVKWLPQFKWVRILIVSIEPFECNNAPMDTG